MDNYSNNLVYRSIYGKDMPAPTEFQIYDPPEMCIDYVTEELDPNIFVNPNESVLYTCNRLKKHNINRNHKHREIYKLYDSIINKTALFVDDVSSKKDAITYSTIITELLWNGILSIDKKFIYEDYLLEVEDFFNGLNVTYGEGCCRHIGSMIKDVLNNLNEDNYLISGETKIKSAMDYFKIIRNDANGVMDNLNGEIETFDSESRHMVNMINYNGKYYLFDATNLLMFKFNKKLKNSIYVGDGTIEIRPHSFLSWNEMSPEELGKLLYRLDINKKSISTEEVINIIQSARKMINVDLMNDFHNEIKDELNDIKSQKIMVLRNDN